MRATTHCDPVAKVNEIEIVYPVIHLAIETDK